MNSCDKNTSINYLGIPCICKHYEFNKNSVNENWRICCKELQSYHCGHLKSNICLQGLKLFSFYHHPPVFIYYNFLQILKQFAFTFCHSQLSFLSFFKFISFYYFIFFLLPLSASDKNVSHKNFSSLSSRSIGNIPSCIESCSSSFCSKSENCFCDRHVFCTAVYENCLKTSTSNENRAKTVPNIYQKSFKRTESTSAIHCKKLYQLDLNLFCNHIPLTSLLPLNGNNTLEQQVICKEDLHKVLKKDKVASDIYDSFVKIMNHFVTSQNYSTKGKKEDCLSFYKEWACAQHHTVYGFDVNSHTWEKLDPCPSICNRTQASCPFFRIGKKSNSLGAQPVFLCNGIGAPRYEPDRAGCYDNDSDSLIYYGNTRSSMNQSLEESARNQHSIVRHSSFLIFLNGAVLLFSCFVFH